MVFEVEGAGRFPIDMLRYDRCFPFDESNSYLIVGPIERRTIKLMAYVDVKSATPCYGRWNSFGWTAHSPEVYKI